MMTSSRPPIGIILSGRAGGEIFIGTSYAIRCCFVIGVQDRNYTVTGRAPVMTVQRDDLGPPERGFQWCVIYTLIPLGFLSYSGKHVVWYIGWQPSGIFGVKFNLHWFRRRRSAGISPAA
jgi:hypothetical protein